MIAFSAILSSPQALALDPARELRQYNIRTWTRQNGSSISAVNAIVQMPDGYLWLGTSRGMTRFDGVTFTRFDLADGSRVSALAPSQKGGIWIAIEGSGLGYFDGQTYQLLADLPAEYARMNVTALTEDGEGMLWVASWKGALRVDPSQSHVDRFASKSFLAYRDRADRIWVDGTDGQFARFYQGKLSSFHDPTATRTALGMTEDLDGNFWIGTENSLLQFDRELKLRATFLKGENVKAVLGDKHGAVWIGTSNTVYRLLHGELEPLPQADLIAPGQINALYEDSEGSLWIGTSEGLTELSDVKFATISASNDPKMVAAVAVAASHHGGVWVAQPNGLTYLPPSGPPLVLGREAGLPAGSTKRVFESRNGDVFTVSGTRTLVVLRNNQVVAQHRAAELIVGLTEDDESVIVSIGSKLFRYEAGTLRPYLVGKVSPDFGWVLNLLTAHDGTLWVASENGVFHVRDGTAEQYARAQGLVDLQVYSLCEDPEGTIWASTMSGIARLKDGRAAMIGSAQGLFDTDIFGLVADRHGTLWVDSSRGIYSVGRESLMDVVEGRSPRVASLVFDGSDAVRPTDKTYQERVAARAADGRIWFGSANGAVVIDPDHIPRNSQAPPVHLTRIEANGQRTAVTPRIVIAPGRGELRVEFDATTFVAPEKVRFQYRLEGYDAQWIGPTELRMAVYNNLHPGHYRFQVKAANADGVWNEKGATFAIELQPHFYQTLWFDFVVATVGGLTLLLAYRVRIRGLHENRMRLEREVQRRTSELAANNIALQHEIEERKRMEREIERTHRELLEVSRRAGMAEVATDVLHNVGNALNSVNVSATLAAEQLQKSHAPGLVKVAALLSEHKEHLGEFLTRDERGQKVPAYIQTLAAQIITEQDRIRSELVALRKHTDHIIEIVAQQQDYTRVAGVRDTVAVAMLIEDTLRMNLSTLEADGIRVVTDFGPTVRVEVERHKVTQILTNLLQNARWACAESSQTEKTVTIRVGTRAARVLVSVEDNGVGIAPENLTRIFAHGFSTRSDGRGFSLHSSALAAKTLSGSLSARSAGVGKGAEFILELPLVPDDTEGGDEVIGGSSANRTTTPIS